MARLGSLSVLQTAHTLPLFYQQQIRLEAIRQAAVRVRNAATVLIACFLVMGEAASTVPVVLLGNHPAGVESLERAVHAEGTMPLELTIVFGLRNRVALEQLLANQQTSTSPQYHQWLTPQTFANRFGPTDKQVGLVADWLKGEGFEVTAVNHVSRTIQVRCDAETAERALATTLVSNGVSFGNTTDPAVPAQFDGLVISILGLDNMHAAVPAGLHRSSLPPYRAPSANLKRLRSPIPRVATLKTIRRYRDLPRRFDSVRTNRRTDVLRRDSSTERRKCGFAFTRLRRA